MHALSCLILRDCIRNNVKLCAFMLIYTLLVKELRMVQSEQKKLRNHDYWLFLSLRNDFSSVTKWTFPVTYCALDNWPYVVIRKWVFFSFS